MYTTLLLYCSRVGAVGRGRVEAVDFSGEHSRSVYLFPGFRHGTASSYYRHSSIVLLPASCRPHTIPRGIGSLQYSLDVSATIQFQ